MIINTGQGISKVQLPAEADCSGSIDCSAVGPGLGGGASVIMSPRSMEPWTGLIPSFPRLDNWVVVSGR